MLSEISGVSPPVGENSRMVTECDTGIPPLTETNRDKAAHRDIINSMTK